MNMQILIGNLGKDPEVKTFEDGGKIANCSLATTETWANRDGEKVSDTQWHNIVFGGKLADVAEKYLHKGDRVAITGSTRHRSWDKDDGTKAYMTEVRVDKMEMLGGRGQQADGGGNSATGAPTGGNSGGNAGAASPADRNDDLPF